MDEYSGRLRVRRVDELMVKDFGWARRKCEKK
jgi:hypothetical protein